MFISQKHDYLLFYFKFLDKNAIKKDINLLWIFKTMFRITLLRICLLKY